MAGVNPVPGPSQTTMEVEKSIERDAEIEKIIKVTNIIIGELGDATQARVRAQMSANEVDVDMSDEISGLLMTVFTCLRKKENYNKEHERYLAYVAKIEGQEISVKTIVEKIEQGNIKFNFLVATPLVEMVTIFREFYAEVRTGVSQFKIRVTKGFKRDSSRKIIEQTRQSFVQYGLGSHHIPLLQGITLAPERRTRTIERLGPMTQSILMVMKDGMDIEDQYVKKLKDALENSLQMLPMSTEIINTLRHANRPESVTGLLKELGDILLLTTAKATQKSCYFPLLFFMLMWANKTNINWSFSGAATIKYYVDLVKSRNVKFVMRSGADPTKTAEAVFHAMFGTYLEDLSVLGQITDQEKWHVREELNSVFLYRREKPQLRFTPITFKYVRTVAQTLKTKSFGQCTCRPSFAGFRKRHFTQEFLSYLTAGKSAITFSEDPIQLHCAVRKVKDSLLKEKDNVLAACTKKWETKVGETWEECDFKPLEGSCQFFGPAPSNGD